MTRRLFTELDVTTNKIVNVKDPTANQDAATKKYVDDTVVAAGGSPNLDGGIPASTYGGVAILDAGGV
ncbi:MAG: hypothetical protein IMZ65_03225 [Planctomycetes bacterium]|nr:hypothetical protein [Planctomycetota bacterium]